MIEFIFGGAAFILMGLLAFMLPMKKLQNI